ncbi:hypothetical protein YC2023_034898 [Brassica napus]
MKTKAWGWPDYRVVVNAESNRVGPTMTPLSTKPSHRKSQSHRTLSKQFGRACRRAVLKGSAGRRGKCVSP